MSVLWREDLGPARTFLASGLGIFSGKIVKKNPKKKNYRQVSPCWERSRPTYSSSSLTLSPIVLSIA